MTSSSASTGTATRAVRRKRGARARMAWCLSALLLPDPLPAFADTAGQSPRDLHHYQLLEQAEARYLALAQRPALTALPPLPARSVRPGEQYAGAAALRELLTALGDLPTPTTTRIATGAVAGPATDELLDEALVEGLKVFQERHALDADGVLGPITWQALTTPLAARLQQIRWTLARWRALPPNPHRRALVINIPRFRLYGLPTMDATEAQLLKLDVVVGQTVEALRTPTFFADLTHVIFRPYWEVPRSIATKELLPAAARDPGYLARNHYEIVDSAGRLVSDQAQGLAAVAAGRARIRQAPGANNALGAVKFVLPNPHDVYLHDTPARELFTRSTRAYSHGCIRVADPAALARFVLQDDPQWTAERIAEAMQGTRPLRVDLGEPVRVYIIYATAIAREDGSVLFLRDLYGLERSAPPSA